MRKERLSIEELQALPKDAFPVTVECDNCCCADHLKKIMIASPVVDRIGCLPIMRISDGCWSVIHTSYLEHYPSLKPEVKKVKWYRVTAWKKGIRVPNEDYALFRDEQDFLSRYRLKKENFHFIELKEVGEWEDFEEVK